MRKRSSWNWFIFKLWIFGALFRTIKISTLPIKNNVVLKAPSKDDIDNFIQLISLHTKKGHYRFPNLHNDEKVMNGLKAQVAQSIYLQRMQFPTGASRSFVISAFAGDNPVGYCWMRSIPESGHSAWEMYMLSIHPDYQREGIAEQLSQFSMTHLPNNVPIMARVFKKSDNAGIKKLLQKIGFTKIRDEYSSETDAYIKNN